MMLPYSSPQEDPVEFLHSVLLFLTKCLFQKTRSIKKSTMEFKPLFYPTMSTISESNIELELE